MASLHISHQGICPLETRSGKRFEGKKATDSRNKEKQVELLFVAAGPCILAIIASIQFRVQMRYTSIPGLITHRFLS